MKKKSLGISADFYVHFIVDLICARCLSQFSAEFNECYHLEYIEGKDPYLSLTSIELKPGDIDRVYYTGPIIDISIGIREAIILSIPQVALCKKDCDGLCPLCGNDLNKGRCNCKLERPNLFEPVKK